MDEEDAADEDKLMTHVGENPDQPPAGGSPEINGPSTMTFGLRSSEQDLTDRIDSTLTHVKDQRLRSSRFMVGRLVLPTLETALKCSLMLGSTWFCSNPWAMERPRTTRSGRHIAFWIAEDLLDGVFDGSVDLSATDVFLHGHSLGAYVVLRSLRGRHGNRVRALLLESPMTCYSPILDEALANVTWVRWIPGFRKRLERALMARWNRLHPEVIINDISDVDVPRWSKPDLPTFVMQADPDRRLGPVHLDALLSCVDSGHLDVEVVHLAPQWNFGTCAQG